MNTLFKSLFLLICLLDVAFLKNTLQDDDYSGDDKNFDDDEYDSNDVYDLENDYALDKDKEVKDNDKGVKVEEEDSLENEEIEKFDEDSLFDENLDSLYNDQNSEDEEIAECRRQRKFFLNSNSTYLPRCTVEGDFEPIQCGGGFCFCVDSNGIQRPGFSFQFPRKPSCPGIRDVVVMTTETIRFVSDGSTDSIIRNDHVHIHTVHSKDYIIWVIVGACIGGIISILVAILCITLRMRKRDEGRYKLHDHSLLYHDSYKAAKLQQCHV